MKEDNVIVAPEIGPDLVTPPHILAALIEVFAGEWQQALSQQEQLLAHLATCCYCRTAAITLLSQWLEYDRRNNNPEKPARDLLMYFANLHRLIEAREAQEYERLGVYAEMIVYEGRDKAVVRFPDIATHLRVCPNCRLALEATVTSITEPDEVY